MSVEDALALAEWYGRLECVRQPTSVQIPLQMPVTE